MAADGELANGSAAAGGGAGAGGAWPIAAAIDAIEFIAGFGAAGGAARMPEGVEAT